MKQDNSENEISEGPVPGDSRHERREDIATLVDLKDIIASEHAGGMMLPVDVELVPHLDRLIAFLGSQHAVGEDEDYEDELDSLWMHLYRLRLRRMVEEGNREWIEVTSTSPFFVNPGTQLPQ